MLRLISPRESYQRRLALALAALFCAGASLHAQDATATDTSGDQGDSSDVLVLPPFMVDASKDVGYLSTNATSGTSLNTALKDLPMALQVINKSFIDDLGATDLDESLSYAAGVFTSDNAASNSVGANRTAGTGNNRSISSAGGGDRFANVVEIRGVPVPFQNRMGFRYGGIVVTPNTSIALGGLIDSVNIDRIEVVKGPNSILYGVGVLTGIVNVQPSRPLSDPHYEVTFNMGSWDFFRSTLDATGPLTKSLLPGEVDYRVAGSYETRGSERDFYKKDVKYQVAQLQWNWKGNVLFLEAQHGNTQYSGIGPQWIYDDLGGANDTEFRNQWDEAYNWARYDGTIQGLRPIDPTSYDPALQMANSSSKQPGWKLMDNSFQGGGKGHNYNIGGPDTHAERDEWDFTADLNLQPAKGWAINAGVLYTEQQTKELTLHFNGAGASSPANFLQYDILDPQLNGIYQGGHIYGWQMQQSVEDAFGLNFHVDPNLYSGDWVLPALNDDVKYEQYWWQRSLIKSRSLQFRVSTTYQFETPFLFGTRAKHLFLAGYNYINDVVDFPDGSIDQRNALANLPSDATSAERTQALTNDALYYRAIDNFSPLYFDGRNDNVDGHNTVRAGDRYLRQDIMQQGFYGIYNGKFFDDRFEVILGARRDIYNAKQRVHKRVDIADDTLQTKAYDAVVNQAEKEVAAIYGSGPDAQQKVDELVAQRTATDAYIANWYTDNVEGVSEGYFGRQYGGQRGNAVDESYGWVPGGDQKLFASDQSKDTFTYAANYDITPNLTIYGVVSEGLSPNTALRDGNGQIIPAETTRNKEIGLKFDAFDRKISGSIAFYRIDLDNAIWRVPLAPSPSKWLDAITSPNRDSGWSLPNYDPSTSTRYFLTSDYVENYLAEVYGIDKSKLSFSSVGVSGGTTIRQNISASDIPDDPNLSPLQNLKRKLQIVNDVKTQTQFPTDMVIGYNAEQQFGGNVSINRIGFDAGSLDKVYAVTLYNPATQQFETKNISSMAMVYSAFMNRQIDKTRNSLLANEHPIRYRGFGGDEEPQSNNNVDIGNSSGALVTFNEQINGAELELIYSPMQNLQFVLTYAHTETKAKNSFNFAEWQSITSGEMPYTPPFNMLYREFGWAQAGVTPAWVDVTEYQTAASGGGVVSADSLSSLSKVDNADATIPVSEFASHEAQGQQLIFVDKAGNVINEANSSSAQDYSGIIDGVNMSFNPNDTASLWSKYTFTSGPLKNLGVNLGVKYVGPSATSVQFHSVSPLNELSFTPETAQYFQVDAAVRYHWTWNDLDWAVSLNVYNLLDHTYDVKYVTLNTPNPITGDTVSKRTESFHAGTSYRLGLTISF